MAKRPSRLPIFPNSPNYPELAGRCSGIPTGNLGEPDVGHLIYWNKSLQLSEEPDELLLIVLRKGYTHPCLPTCQLAFLG